MGLILWGAYVCSELWEAQDQKISALLSQSSCQGHGPHQHPDDQWSESGPTLVCIPSSDQMWHFRGHTEPLCICRYWQKSPYLPSPSLTVSTCSFIGAAVLKKQQAVDSASWTSVGSNGPRPGQPLPLLKSPGLVSRTQVCLIIAMEHLYFKQK